MRMKMKMKRILCLTSLMALSAISSDIPVASAAGAEASSQEKPAASVEVKIDNFSFGPQSLTVAVGTTVTWTNRDDIPHNVVADDKSFKSKVLDTDEKFSYTFTKAGTYPYFCGIHPKMTGKVIVQ